MANAVQGPRRSTRRKRSFLPAAKVGRAEGSIGTAVAESLRKYEASSTLRIARLTRPSVRKAVGQFAEFCFKQREIHCLTRRDPKALERSLLAWFDESDFVIGLLELGRNHREQIEESLEILVDGYDDPTIPNELPNFRWWPEPAGHKVEAADDISFALIGGAIRGKESDSTTLAAASKIYRRAGNDRLSKLLTKDAEQNLLKVAPLRRTLERLEENFETRPRAEGAGAPRQWLTPILAEMEEVLHGVDGHWKLLAQLVREIEKKPSYTGEAVRSRLNDFMRRSNRK